jgi:YebC/PmpR family DNA-binding regulatory protein
MSGHSKWAKIKRTKGALDQKRGKIFSKIGREIQLAAKAGGGSPETNIRLRNILLKAKEVSMPSDTIKRAINKGIGTEASDLLEEMVYEGYGPGGVAILVEVVTDNRNRTASDIRSIFTKNNGNMGESGSVGFLFDKKGLILIKKDLIREDALMELILNSGAEDLKTDKQDIYEIISSVENFSNVRSALEKKEILLESAEITMIPKTLIALDEKKTEAVLKLVDALDDHDDVQNVFSNIEISEALMDKFEKKEI